MSGLRCASGPLSGLSIEDLETGRRRFTTKEFQKTPRANLGNLR